MTHYEKHLRDSFSTYTDDELVAVLEAGKTLKPISDHYDGTLLSVHVAQQELTRRHTAHLDLFFGI